MRTLPACSASISRVRSCRAERPGVHSPGRSARRREDDLAMLTSLAAGRRSSRSRRNACRKASSPSLRRRRAGFARPFDGDLRGDARGDRGWADRLHASLQRDAPAASPRARSDRRRARSGGVLVRADRRRRACRSAMLRLALRGAGRPMLVTDAMPPVGGRKDGFTLYGEEITRARRAPVCAPTARSRARRSTWPARCATRSSSSAPRCPMRCASPRATRPNFWGWGTGSAGSRRVAGPISWRSCRTRSGCCDLGGGKRRVTPALRGSRSRAAARRRSASPPAAPSRARRGGGAPGGGHRPAPRS